MMSATVIQKFRTAEPLCTILIFLFFNYAGHPEHPISSHVPLFIKETAMGLTAMGSTPDNKSAASGFNL